MFLMRAGLEIIFVLFLIQFALKKSQAKLRILMRQTIKYARTTFQDHSFGLQVAPRVKHCLKNTKILFQGPVKSPQDQTTKKNIRLEPYTEKQQNLKK